MAWYVGSCSVLYFGQPQAKPLGSMSFAATNLIHVPIIASQPTATRTDVLTSSLVMVPVLTVGHNYVHSSGEERAQGACEFLWRYAFGMEINRAGGLDRAWVRGD